MPEVHSTGRGGAGNIGKDPNVYTDGSIVREGIQGKSAGPGEYSTGRGGAGNIEPTAQHAHSSGPGPTGRTDADVIPEPAMIEKHQEVFHTGRGGQGNVHKDKYGGHSKPQSAEHMAQFHAASNGGQGVAPPEEKNKQKEPHHASMGDKVKHLFDKKH